LTPDPGRVWRIEEMEATQEIEDTQEMEATQEIRWQDWQRLEPLSRLYRELAG
jgi:hypothetical protein